MDITANNDDMKQGSVFRDRRIYANSLAYKDVMSHYTAMNNNKEYLAPLVEEVTSDKSLPKVSLVSVTFLSESGGRLRTTDPENAEEVVVAVRHHVKAEDVPTLKSMLLQRRIIKLEQERTYLLDELEFLGTTSGVEKPYRAVFEVDSDVEEAAFHAASKAFPSGSKFFSGLGDTNGKVNVTCVVQAPVRHAEAYNFIAGRMIEKCAELGLEGDILISVADHTDTGMVYQKQHSVSAEDRTDDEVPRRRRRR